MNIEAPREANPELAESREPGMPALDHPTMPPELLATFDTAASNTDLDVALSQIASATSKVISFVGVQFGRPFARLPFRPGTAGMASNAIESCRLAPVIVTARGMPRASTTMCRFEPSLPRSVGLGPVSWPPGGWRRWLHPGWRAPNRSAVFTQPAQQRQVQSMPYTGRLPISQTSPARHDTAEAQLLRAVFPRDAGLQHIQDAVERSSVIDRAPASALGRGGEFRDLRFRRHPQLVADFASCDAADDTTSAASCPGCVSDS